MFKTFNKMGTFYICMLMILILNLTADAAHSSSSASATAESGNGGKSFAKSSASASACSCPDNEDKPGETTCNENERLNECPNRCDSDSCPINLNNQTESDCIAAAVCLPPQCQCIPNYKRDANNDCVPIQDCPGICPENEEYSDCTQAICRVQNCSQKGQPVPCPAIAEGSCKSGCVCQSGYLRTADGNCVSEDRCHGELECDENETVVTCPGSCSDYCPTSNDTDICSITDPTPDSCGTPKCQCRFNYKRSSETGTCIPTRDCPPFDCSAEPNQEYNSCPPFCPSDDCSQASPTGRCPFPGRIGIVLQCNPKCRCIKGYWKNDGICVPYADCPGICPKNEEFSNCTQALCRGENCTQIGQAISCPEVTDGSCQQGCVCVQGTLRAANGSCIPEDQCPEICGENEVLNKCPSVCKTDACPKNFTNGNEVPCVKSCGKPKCQCIPNYARDDNSACIPIGDCPEICSENEEYSNCTQAICRIQDCSQKDQPLACPAIAEGSCESGCICQVGYLRTADGDCIPEDRCNGDLVCDENETVVTCPGPCSDYCPTSNDTDICSLTDPTPDSCGTPKCQCRFNYKRSSETGTCIPTRDCPPFDCSAEPNQEYNSCPPFCPSDDCSQASPTGRCPLPGRIGIVLQCNPKCRCIKGYWKNDGICVPYADCPGICPMNEEYSNCTQALCRGENCTQIGQAISCPEITDGSCQQGCVCVKGTLRATNGSCIPEDQCPGLTCGEFEKLNECTSVCKSDGCPKNMNGDSEGIACIDVCGPPKCECIQDYKRDDNGNCIPIRDCPGICPVNEEYSSCTQSLCRAQNCTQIGQPIACPRVREGFCLQGCVCIEGTLRNENGTCVLQDQCSADLVCGENEEVNNCTNSCYNDYCPRKEDDKECISSEVCGPPKCQCIENYKRNCSGACIPIEKCQQQQCSGRNEVLSCVDECPPERSCRNRGIQFRCREPDTLCQEKCICETGYYRNANRECVTGEECDMCKGKNEFFSCGPECDNVCKDLDTQNRTNCPFVNIQCNRKCYCQDGFARDDNQTCVPVDKCPIKENKCSDPNEEFYDCKRICPPDTCVSLVMRKACPENPVCEPGCSCKPGFFRQKDGLPCGPACSCEEMKNSTDC